MKYKAVIFDFDYTLGDCTEGIAASVNHGLKKLGYDGGFIAELYGYPAEIKSDGIRKSVKWIKETWEKI